jgi:hypothetical protein
MKLIINIRRISGHFARSLFLVGIAGLLGTASSAAYGQTANAPYTVSVFAKAPAGLTNPDSITLVKGDVFVSYANASTPDGKSGNSTVVQFNPAGQVLRTYTIIGKNDGLKFNPYDGKVWALRNEDSNPALTIIDPNTGSTTDYTFGPTLHGGGYDDVVFLNGQIYISASNPTLAAPTTTTPNGQNINPSIVRAILVGHTVEVVPVLNGNTTLTNIATGKPAVSQQSDPDSLKVDSAGNLVLDSQADGDLIFVNHPASPNQTGQLLHLTDGTSTQITVDDTVFPTSAEGTILVVDTAGDTVFAVTSTAFQPGGAYSASDTKGSLGKVDLSTGLFTPIVTGMKSPHGAVFVSALPDVTIAPDEDFGFSGGGVKATFAVTRTGDVSKPLTVRYFAKDNSKESADVKRFSDTVTIPAGKSSQKFQVRLASIAEDGPAQSVTAIVEPGDGYNVKAPATALVDLPTF